MAPESFWKVNRGVCQRFFAGVAGFAGTDLIVFMAGSHGEQILHTNDGC